MTLRADETVHAHSAPLTFERGEAVIDLTEPSTERTTAGSEHRAVPVPLEIRAAQQWTAEWLIAAEAAERLLDGSGLRPARALPGRGVLSISFARVLDSDLGRYHQLRVTVAVRRHDEPTPGAHRLDAVGDARGELVLDQPADLPLANEVGHQVWGSPSRRADVEIAPQRNRTACTLTSQHGHELTLAIVDGGALPLPSTAPPVYTRDGDALRLTTWRFVDARGGRRPGGADLVLSRNGPLAAQLRSLGLPKRALCVTTISRLRSTYDAPCLVRPTP